MVQEREDEYGGSTDEAEDAGADIGEPRNRSSKCHLFLFPSTACMLSLMACSLSTQPLFAHVKHISSQGWIDVAYMHMVALNFHFIMR